MEHNQFKFLVLFMFCKISDLLDGKTQRMHPCGKMKESFFLKTTNIFPTAVCARGSSFHFCKR